MINDLNLKKEPYGQAGIYRSTIWKGPKETIRTLCVTRIWHLLLDSKIKCITQEYVGRPDGRRAMTDLYLPQLGIQIETDEAHHLGQVELDQIWEKDIINATKHVFKHVKVNCGIDEVNRQIDEIVTFIKLKIAEKNASGDFKSWDLEAEQNPETYIKNGYIDASEDVAFRTISGAASCF
ncbi:MAG: AbaSI family restriction endonuclease [Pyrinomonadaceae bacterium]